MLVDAEESLARVIRAENNAVELINEANELGTAIDEGYKALKESVDELIDVRDDAFAALETA